MSLRSVSPQISCPPETRIIRKGQYWLKFSAGAAREPPAHVHMHARTSSSEFFDVRKRSQSTFLANRFCKYFGASDGKLCDAALSMTSNLDSKRSRERRRSASSRATLQRDNDNAYRVVRCDSHGHLVKYPDHDQESSLYHRFVEHAIEQSSQHMRLTPFPMKTKYQELVAKDGKAVTNSVAFQSEKVRQFRAAEINGGRSIQVLNLLVFPSAAYDLPIFCADLVTFAKNHLIVLDLNPLYSADMPRQYWEKYISPLSPVWKKYHQVLPWGGELTREAAEFFSPYVLWSKPIKEQSVDDIVFAAFKDYFKTWLDMVDKAEASNHADEIYKNQEAQHRYMSWRSTKDPGRNLLTRLYGETLCEEYMKDFLFAELENMGTKSFLDYFPQFRDQNGSIQKQRSMAGKAYSTRPWDENGNRINASA